ncbi:MAG: NAD(P)-dependent glycerol-1-phosphate dehydrogenase [Candidatus Altiarchaeota archaeon]
MKDIELPRKVLIGEKAVYEIDDLVDQLGLEGDPFILCDPTTKKIAGDIVADELDSGTVITEDSSGKELELLEASIVGEDIGYVIGVGGGRVLDTGKIIAFNTRRPFISVPTSASHDGIASPQASLKKDKPISLRVHSPLGIIADTRIISESPKRLLSAGCADAISNYTAVLDWKLAHREKGEYYGDYASALSEMSARIIMDNGEKVMADVSILVEALISSGVAIGIAGSSRPCSGSEHLFSHTLDIICEKPALHGEQCGVGAIMSAYLHEADWKAIKGALKRCGAPTTAKELGIQGDIIVEALTKAQDTRDRYTILREGLSEEKAREAAESTGVI